MIFSAVAIWGAGVLELAKLGVWEFGDLSVNARNERNAADAKLEAWR